MAAAIRARQDFVDRNRMQRAKQRLAIGGGLVLVGVALVLAPWAARGQSTGQSLPGAQSSPEGKDVRFTAEVNLVALYAAVVDQNQQLVTGLPREAFQVFQDGKEQTITQFSNRDIPVSMGVLVDNSASMTDKRAAVNAAALALVRASNPEDEVFILNFKDTPEVTQDYTNDIALLAQGLSEVRMWGGTAVLDAVRAGVEHALRGTRDKKVLLAITDGEDESSKLSLKELWGVLQKAEVTIYTIGILSRESSRSRRNAEKMLQAIADVSGGAAYFPNGLEEVEALATRIAHDIRNQYVLGYPVPAGTKPGFHSIRVQVVARGRGKLSVRTRPGFFYEPSSRIR
ncbi:MAG: VWA domain-containing protein [Acidobacteria bacterium]|nr:VWA domain-containing protein [Acidobacteriota bacterium]